MSSVRSEAAPGIRPMQHRDLPEIAAIERRSYEFPWSQGVFRDCLLAGYQCLVLEQAEQVQGYAILSVAAGEAHILNLCIAAEVRAYGFGAMLLDQLLAHARSAEAERVLLEVRPSNTVAIGLYRKRGFMQIGTRHHYYQAVYGREDAMVFALPLNNSRT
ncbi:MAG: ribosomal protein S18-alanine N-acetyltransferase [Pseudomonadota bacterium]